jgi:hypothetical protein
MTDDGAERDDATEPEDPFDRLGRATDRDGDPFERLDDEPTADSAADATVDDEPWTPPGTEQSDATADDEWSGPAPTETDAVDVDQPPLEEPSDPFANVDTPSESAFDGPGNVFERIDAGAVDPDQVWESITAEDDDAGDDPEPSVPDEGRYSDVSKHRFCEGCEHFSPPPDVACGHHTAEIIEFLDMETVRLRNCPVVAEREELERSG